MNAIVAVKSDSPTFLPRTALHIKRFPPARFPPLLEVAAQAGVGADEILRGSGLDEAAVRNPRTRTSVGQFLQVARNLLEHFPGSGVGLLVGQRLRLSGFGMVGYALLCAADLRQAYDVAARHSEVTGAVVSFRWFERADCAVWEFATLERLRLERPDLDIEPALYRFLVEMQMMVTAVGSQAIMGAQFLPVRARFAMKAPSYASGVALALGCPVEFDQPVNEIHFPASWLERAPPLANPITAAQVSQSCAQMLDDIEAHCTAARSVVEELTRKPGHFPSMAAISLRLHTTSRNLRRKLAAEGTAYQTLLINVRHSLAKDYLSRSALSIDEIALALGFSDAASFRHAFKRWTGMTPSQFRA